jgi:hypothetical protein
MPVAVHLATVRAVQRHFRSQKRTGPAIDGCDPEDVICVTVADFAVEAQ